MPMPTHFPKTDPQRLEDFLTLILHEWDIFYALAAIEDKYKKTFSYSYASSKAKFLSEFAIKKSLPIWVKPYKSYKKKAERIEEKVKLSQTWAHKPMEPSTHDEELKRLRLVVEKSRGVERELAVKAMNAYSIKYRKRLEEKKDRRS